MTRKASSLGELITALYDVATEVADGDAATGIVAACTFDVLIRQRRRRLVAELVDTRDRLPN